MVKVIYLFCSEAASGSYDKAHPLDNWLYQLVILILAKITWESDPPFRSGLLDGTRWSIVKGLQY